MSIQDELTKRLPSWAKPKPVDMMGDYTKAYKVKTRFGMLGPVMSGKSTIASAIVHTCETLSSLQPNFYCRVLPTSTHILSDANNLCLGHFPEKTDPFTPRAPEAGLLICQRGWREKKVQVPICDVAGEITDYIAARASGYTPNQMIEQRMQNVNTEVVNTIKDCQGFIIALAAPDALMFRTRSKFDPDVYTHTVMNEILEHRRRNRKDDPHMIVVLTKWDEVIEKAQEIGMDIYESQESLDRFLANGFPATSMLLKPLRDKGNVRYFRSWFHIKRREDGAKEYWDAEKKRPVIDVLEDANAYIRFKPRFADSEYKALVEYIGSFGD